MPREKWVSRYVGIPFKEDGLTREGCHCWGLCHLVLREQCGIETPTYAEQSAADLIAAARFFRGEPLGDPWSKADDPREFDVVLMSAMSDGPRPRVLAGHCGIMTNETTLLHVWSATHAVQMKIDHARIRHKISGFYRHKALA